MSQGLTESAKEFLREPVLAHTGSIDAAGRPDTPVWFDVDGDDVVPDEHIHFLARKGLRADYPNRRAGEQRVTVRIRPERIAMQPQ